MPAPDGARRRHAHRGRGRRTRLRRRQAHRDHGRRARPHRDDTGSFARDWDSPDWDNGDWDYGDDPYFDEDGLGDVRSEDPFHDGRPDDHHRFEGRIISRDGLAHNRPDRRSRIIRIAPHDERVHIYCKTRGSASAATRSGT